MRDLVKKPNMTMLLGMQAAPALSCGTLIAGAALNFTLRKRDTLDVGVAAVLKLIVLPLAAAGIAIPIGSSLTGATLASAVLICAIPTAPSAYVLASRMGGDTRLMASITGAQTILAVASYRQSSPSLTISPCNG